MLARLTGTLIALEGNLAVVAPAGMAGCGYEVMLPAYLAQDLVARGWQEGDAIELHTIQYLEGLNQGTSFIPRLIGFASGRERAFFELLTSVKGLGNKRALRAMAVPIGSMARAIGDRDARYLQSLPEIGPKLAELIVHELKGKVDGFIGLDVGLDVGMGSVQDAAGDGAGGAGAVVVKGKGKGKAGGGGAGGAGGVGGAGQKAASASVEPKPGGGGGAVGGAGAGVPSRVPNRVPSRLPIREAIEALVALGETPVDAERLVSKAVERARGSAWGSAGGSEGEHAAISTTAGLLTAALAVRGGA